MIIFNDTIIQNVCGEGALNGLTVKYISHYRDIDRTDQVGLIALDHVLFPISIFT